MKVNSEKQVRLLEGKVVSDKMDKTIVVEVEQTYIHPKFRKILRKTKSYKVLYCCLWIMLFGEKILSSYRKIKTNFRRQYTSSL